MKRAVVCVVSCCALVAFGSPLGFADDKGATPLAEFEGGKLTVEEFASRQPALLSWAGIGVDTDQIQRAVEDMVLENMIAREAQASDVAKQPEVQLQIQRILKTAYLKEHVNLDDVEVDEDDIERYYKKNREAYKKPDIIRISQILVATLEEAQRVRQEATDSNWSKLASQSKDPITAKRQGSFGEMEANQLMPELRKVAEALPLGAISEPVKTQFGYHILKINSTPEKNYIMIDEVRKDIRDELVRIKRRDLLNGMQKQLWSKYDVSVDRPAIEAMVAQNQAQNANVDTSSRARPRSKVNKDSELQVITELIDLGPIEPKKVSDSILVTNTSDRPLQIARVGSSCPCIEATIADRELKPGQVTKVNFTYDPERMKDGARVERVVVVESNDSVDPRKYIRIRADVKRTARGFTN